MKNGVKMKKTGSRKSVKRKWQLFSVTIVHVGAGMHFSAFCKLAEKYFLVGMNSLGTLRRVYWEWLYANSSSWCSLEATHFYFS